MNSKALIQSLKLIIIRQYKQVLFIWFNVKKTLLFFVPFTTSWRNTNYPEHDWNLHIQKNLLFIERYRMKNKNSES